MDNIAINCSGFTETQKQYVQEAFFKMGYWWSTPGYQFLDANVYGTFNGFLSVLMSCENSGIKAGFPNYKFLTFNELMKMADYPWRMMNNSTIGPDIKIPPNDKHIDGIKVYGRTLPPDDDVKPLGTNESYATRHNRTKPRNKYDREIVPGVFVDVYDVLGAFKTDSPAVDHAVKKLLAPGKRGHKDRVTDLKEAIASIESEIAKINEWSE